MNKKYKKVSFIPPDVRFALHLEALEKFAIDCWIDHGTLSARVNGKIGSYVRKEARRRGLMIEIDVEE